MGQSSKEYFREYYLRNKEHKKEIARKYYEQTKDKAFERAANWVKHNPEKRMLIRAKYRAKQKGLEFNIDLSDVVIPTHCPILGIELVIHFGDGRSGGWDNSPSLDRIDNSKGYVKGNVQVISQSANSKKSNK